MAAHHAGGIKVFRQHMQVAETNPLARGHDVKTGPARCAQHHPVARGHGVMDVRFAGVARSALPAERWPDVLTLVAEAARTLAYLEVAHLTKIVAPWI